MARKKLDEAKRFKLVSQAGAGSCLVLQKFAVTLLDLESKDKNVGSGTLVSLGNRLLIATAAHVIPSNPTGRLWLIRRQGRYAKDGFPGFLKWRRHPDPRKDVGYLEVNRQTVTEYLDNDDFCTIDNIANFGAGRKNRGTIVVGTPAAKVQPQTVGETAILKFEVMPYWTTPLMPKQWPRVGKHDTPPDYSIDVFLEYPETESRDVHTNRPSKVPNAVGMSGGGIWDQGFGLRKIWDPRDCKLYAIQSGWEERKRYLRGVQIGHWIELVASDYPDLAKVFAAQPVTQPIAPSKGCGAKP